MSNEFDAAVSASLQSDKAQAARVGFSVASDTNPDAYAEAQRVARRTGVPVDTAMAMPQEIKRQARMGEIDFDTMTKVAPATAALLADVEKAKIAHDDVENMGLTETLFNSFKRGVPALRSMLPTISATSHANTLNQFDQIDSGEKIDKAKLNPIAAIYQGMKPEERKAYRASYTPRIEGVVADSLTDLVARTKERQAIPAPGVVGEVMQAKSFGEGFSTFMKDPVKFIFSIGPESMVQQAPGMLAAVLSGNPAIGAASMGTNSFMTDYAGAIVESLAGMGVDTNDKEAIGKALRNPQMLRQAMSEATSHAAVVGAVDAASGGMAGKSVLPKSIAARLASRPVAERAANMAVQAPAQGVLGAAGEAGGQIAAGKELKPGEIIAEFAGEFFGTPGEVLAMSAGRVRARIAEASQAQQSTEIIGQINELARANKVLMRDPETFQQFVAQATAEGPVQAVFIDANTLMQSGVSEQIAQLSPAVAEQLQNASESGGQIAIPVDEYAAKIAPTEYAQGLLDHLKTDPEGFSRAEAQQYMQSHAEELKAEVERTLAEKKGDETFKAGQEAVKQEVLGELTNANRFRPEVNDLYATMIAARSAVRAAQLGMTPEAFFRDQKLRVGAESVAGGRQFNQGESADNFLAMFDDANTINIEAPNMTEQEINDAEARFLSAFPEGSRYPRSTRLLKRIRRASEVVANELGENPETTRRNARAIGPFSGYEIKGEVLPPDSFHPNGLLVVKVTGDEQVAAGLTDQPALTFTVSADGELTVNGPTPGSETFNEFKKRGWADLARGENGEVQAGWSALTDPNNPGKPLPAWQITPLLADVHARVRAWRMEDYVGLHWSRATGALGGLSGMFAENGTAVFFQNKGSNRGAFNPESSVITLLKGADLSTFLHEAGHYFFESDITLAAELVAEAKIHGYDNLHEGEREFLRDVHALMTWHGIDGDIDAQLLRWNNLDFEEKRAHHERTAEAFETYLFEGKAPSIELQRMFQTFRAWLMNVYRSVTDFLAGHPEAGKINDEVRGIFDRMLATSEQIQLAEQGRSMMPLFMSAEQAGMTPDEFAAYQALGTNATNDAIEDVQARGLRDMQWLHNARGKIIKKLQKDAKAQRAAVEMDVRREVMSQPIYRAWQFLTGKLTADDKVENPTPPKSDPDTLDETIDSLFVAIAKLGGIAKDEAISTWGIDPADKPQSGVFGKPVWRRQGGLSLDGMVEALVQHGYLEADEHGKADIRELEDKFKTELSGDAQHSVAYDYSAQQQVQPGEQIANPDALNAGRLDLASLSEIGVPVEVINSVKARRMTAKEGLHPDIVAEMYGFTSGDELVRKLAAAETPQSEIEALTDMRMLEQFGELSSPEAIERAADKAIHNDARARMVATELNALAKATGQRKTLASAAKEYAAAMIARLKVRDIRPGQYASAEVRAAKASEKASKGGDIAVAAAEKRNQLINNYATRAAYDAQDEVDAGLRYLKKFDGDIKSLDVEYADQIANLLDRFDLRKGQSLKALDKRTALTAWITAQREAGFEPDIPADLENEAYRTSYKNLTIEEFRGLLDTVKQIEHLGRLKHTLLTARDQRAYEAVRDSIVVSIQENAQGREADTRTPTTNMGRAVQGLKRFWASHIKAATWARVLDGGKDGGPMWEYFVRSANEAGDSETTMRAEATRKLSEILAPVFKLGRMGGKGQFFESIGRSLNREARIALALNTGNDGNLQRLLGGEGWTIQQVAPVLQTLTAQEWATVQAVWDHFESYRPQIAAKERRVYGKEPEWVDARPFAVTTADGSTVQMRGGYYPIKYDPAASQRAEEHADAEGAKRQLQGAYTTATTRRSFTKSRAEEVSGRPLLYTLSGLYSGVNDVIHDLAWHEWLIDTNRLLRSSSIDSAIREHYGPEAKQQFKTWAQDIAEGEKGADAAVDLALSRLRQGVSAAGLGFNVMSAMIQPLGITQSITRVGAPWVGRGVLKYLANPVKLSREVAGMSDFMANRSRTRFRELNELRNQVQDQTAFQEIIGRYAYFLMMRCQQMVDVPTWWGAYEKAIADGNDETRAASLADQAVIDSQGGGQTKDLSAIERGGPAQRLFTVFYSFMNTALNIGVSQTMSADTSAKKARLAVDYAMLYVVPAILGYFLKAALTPGDSGDDDLEKISKKLAANQIDYLMGLMVVVREFGDAAKTMSGANDMGRDYTGPAGLRMVADVGRLAKQAHQGEFDDAFRKAAINVLGDLFALPSAQVNRTITGTKALIEGKTENPAAVAFGFQEKR